MKTPASERAPERPSLFSSREGTEVAVRTMLIVGPIALVVGIAWTAIAPSSLSNAAIIVGFATCIYGTHRFGRLGPAGSTATSVSEEGRKDDVAL
ncbi:MAG: hypothetical protein NVS3B20_12910 [Polyangiales bacterium]